MHIVSYRGPGMAGGVSTALARAWESNRSSASAWWHLTGDNLEMSVPRGTKATVVASLADALVQGHYRFCNEFLWPVMHDLPHYASYNSEDHAYYKTFNETLGWCIVRAAATSSSRGFFVQDYQLALLPQFLRSAGLRSGVFWHIPWPSNVEDDAVPVICGIARGLLNAEIIGFHTQEYADNFLEFVRRYLPEFLCNPHRMVIWKGEQLARVDDVLWAAPNRAWALRTAGRVTKQVVRLAVAPLGIDFDYWRRMAASQTNTVWHPSLMRLPFVLSVDRADYTKGVVDRLRAIDLFFQQHPQLRERITFAQICGKTRDKLPAFEAYWQECQQLAGDLKEHWATPTWQPLTWLECSFGPADLAHAYNTASAMLIPAVRDGLNLTAKEFIACQGANPGALLLSSGTGAWQELKGHCLRIEPNNPQQIADAVWQAMSMDNHERRWRMSLLQDAVRTNGLSRWWQTFASALGEERAPAATQLRG